MLGSKPSYHRRGLYCAIDSMQKRQHPDSEDASGGEILKKSRQDLVLMPTSNALTKTGESVGPVV